MTLRSAPARFNAKVSSFSFAQTVLLVRERYSDFGLTLATEYLADYHEICVSRETLRKCMVEDGIRTTRAAWRKRVHQRRQRRECRVSALCVKETRKVTNNLDLPMMPI